MTRLWAALVAVALCATACGGDADESDTVIISVASSLTDRFTANVEQLRMLDSDSTIQLNFAGSSVLVSQVNEGAPVDIIAVADVVAADAITAEVFRRELIGESELRLVRHEDTEPILALDAIDPDLIVAACDAALPCGRLTDSVLAENGVSLDIDVREANVRAVLGRVSSGEADVGFVYDTEATALPAGAVAVPFRLSEQRNDRVLLLLDTDSAAQDVFNDLLILEKATIGFAG